MTGNSNSGRPSTTQEEKDLIFQKLEPYLQSGLSVGKACLEAKIPNSTIYELLRNDDIFSEKIKAAKQYLSVIISRSTMRELHQIVKKQQELLKKQEKNEAIKPSDLVTKEDKDFLQWFATHHTSTREEFSDRKDISVIDPQEEIRKLGKLIDDESEDEDDDDTGESAETKEE